MQEAYVPPVQLDKSELNWASKKKKNKNMQPYAVLHPGTRTKQFLERNIYLQLKSLKVQFQLNL